MPTVLVFLLLSLPLTGAIQLNGSEEYAYPGSPFALICRTEIGVETVIFYCDHLRLFKVLISEAECHGIFDDIIETCSPHICSCQSFSSENVMEVRYMPYLASSHVFARCYCTAQQGLKSLKSSDYVINRGVSPASSMALSVPDSSYTARKGDVVEDINCTADCAPDCSFVWTRPGNINLTASPLLSLGQLDRPENGTYTCIASNTFGNASKTLDIIVQYGPENSTLLSPPIKTYIINEGDRIKDIVCAAVCSPDCTYVWTGPDNTSIISSSVLSLRNLNRSDQGTYTCTAINLVGEFSNSIDVIIQYGPGSSVVLSYPFNTYTENEGEDMENITCSANCKPACNMVWTKPDGTNYTRSDVLSLGKLEKSEIGTYLCIAQNPAGEASILLRIKPCVQGTRVPHQNDVTLILTAVLFFLLGLMGFTASGLMLRKAHQLKLQNVSTPSDGTHVSFSNMCGNETAPASEISLERPRSNLPVSNIQNDVDHNDYEDVNMVIEGIAEDDRIMGTDESSGGSPERDPQDDVNDTDYEDFSIILEDEDQNQRFVGSIVDGYEPIQQETYQQESMYMTLINTTESV